MTDHDDGPTAGIDSFQDWLQQTAEREGRSPDDVLHNMVSTYWILNELQESVSEFDLEGDEPTQSAPTPPSMEQSTSEDGMDIEAVIDAIMEAQTANQPPEPPKQDSAIDSNLIDLIRVVSDRQGEGGGDNYTIQRLIDRIEHRQESLEERTSDRIASVEGDVDELGDQLEDRLASFDERMQSTREEVRDVISSLSNQVETVEGDVDEFEDRLSEIDDELGMVLTDMDDLSGDLDHLFQRLDDDFDELAGEITALEARLEEVSGAINDRVSSLTERIDEEYVELDERTANLSMLFDHADDELVKLREAQESDNRLENILNQAQANSVSNAECEGCHEDIDLSLLASPQCPACDREFGSLRMERSWFRKQPYLTTINADPTIDITSLRDEVVDETEE